MTFSHMSTTIDSTAGKPTLSVVPATIDDLETLTRIQYEATASTAPIHAIIFRNGATETIIAADLAGKKRGFSKPEVHYHKVVANAGNGNDGGGGEIAAISRWYIWPEGRSDESWTKPYVYTPDEAHAPDDINHAAAIEYYTKADAMKKRNIQNKPHLYISLLATRPEWQGKGCGKLLMDEAFRVAREQGLKDIFLMSVAASRSFYERHNIEPVEKFSLNLTSLAGEDVNKPEEWVDTILMRASP